MEGQGTYGISTFQDVPAGDCNSLQADLVVQPISDAVNANNWSHLYTGGIFPADLCNNELDHAVLLVGSGTNSTTNETYWIVQNSWGTTWGE